MKPEDKETLQDYIQRTKAEVRSVVEQHQAEEYALSTYWLDDAYADVFQFNDIAGNTEKVSVADLYKQYCLIQEECIELQDEIETYSDVTYSSVPIAAKAINKENLLGETIDMFVVLSGFMSKLQSLGFDVSKALQKTNASNLSKFPSIDRQVITDTYQKYADKGIEVEVQYKGDKMIFKNKATGKVLKPSSFVPKDLSDCVEGVILKD